MKTCQGCGAPVASAHCGWCGRSVAGDPELAPAADSVGRAACPRCSAGRSLTPTTLAGHPLSACAACGGLWVPHASFTPLADAPRQPAAPRAETARPITETEVRYLKCPQCAVLMLRRNFEGISGVVLDTCAPHGLWLDAGELPAIRQFIAGGGLERAAALKAMEAERRADHARDRVTPPAHAFTASYTDPSDSPWGDSPLGGFLRVLGRVLR